MREWSPDGSGPFREEPDQGLTGPAKALSVQPEVSDWVAAPRTALPVRTPEVNEYVPPVVLSEDWLTRVDWLGQGQVFTEHRTRPTVLAYRRSVRSPPGRGRRRRSPAYRRRR